MAINADFDMLRQRKSPAKSQRKGGAKGSVAVLKESFQLGCVSQDSHPRKSFLRKQEKLGSSHAVKFSKGARHQIKIRERKGPSRGIVQKCEPHERSPCAPKFERPQSSMGFVEKKKYKLKNANKATFFTPVEARVMPAPITSKRNAHDEQKRLKLRWIGHFAKVQEHHSGAHCHWRSARPRGSTSFRSRFKSITDCAITRRIASSPIAWKTLRRHGYSYEWVSGQKPRLTKQGQTIVCKTDNFVPLVVPGLSANSGSDSSSTWPPQDSSSSSSSPVLERS